MIKKTAWLFVYLYVLGFAGYGIFGLGILKNVSWTGFQNEFKTRQMPWEKTHETKVSEPTSSDRKSVPKIEISFEKLDNVG